MNYNRFIGIDVSKLTLDAFFYGKSIHQNFNNDQQGFKSFVSWARQQMEKTDLSQVLVCFEHTGVYSLSLALYLQEVKVPFVMIPGLEIKRSLGIARGKSDQVDACRIAEYAYQKREKLVPTALPSKTILRLQPLLTLRNRLITQNKGYQATEKEQQRAYKKAENTKLYKIYGTMIKACKEQIKEVEAAIKELIDSDPQIKQTFTLITTIKGVGLVTGAYMITYTHHFTRFSSWRKFACYAGVAPFPHQSGTSVRGKTKVSALANKEIKSLLYLAASNAARFDNELKLYYQKRIKEGKSKMSTLNMIKNKLIARIFAVANRQSPYIQTMRFAS